jgi:dTDP-4-dehydrorhamnose reductase
MERMVLDAFADALVVRTAAFFSPWDEYNFVTIALRTLASGRAFQAAADLLVSPTYVPDLVNVTLDLLVDHERGVWHLANRGGISWAQLARSAAELAGLDAKRVEACSHAQLGWAAPRPLDVRLDSVRGALMPPLEDALARYIGESSAGRVMDVPDSESIPA